MPGSGAPRARRRSRARPRGGPRGRIDAMSAPRRPASPSAPGARAAAPRSGTPHPGAPASPRGARRQLGRAAPRSGATPPRRSDRPRRRRTSRRSSATVRHPARHPRHADPAAARTRRAPSGSQLRVPRMFTVRALVLFVVLLLAFVLLLPDRARVPGAAGRGGPSCAPQVAAARERNDDLEAELRALGRPGVRRPRRRASGSRSSARGRRRTASSTPRPSPTPRRPPAGPARRPSLGLRGDDALVRERLGVGRGRGRDARAGCGGCGDAGRQWDARAARRRLTGPPARTDRPVAPSFDDVTDQDIAVLAEQLGRVPRGVVGIAARCVCGRPLVVRTAPRLRRRHAVPDDLLPHAPPRRSRRVSTLEAGGLMKESTARLADDAELAAAYRPRARALPGATARRSGTSRRSRASPPAACRPGSSACTSSWGTRSRPARASTRSATRRSPSSATRGARTAAPADAPAARRGRDRRRCPTTRHARRAERRWQAGAHDARGCHRLRDQLDPTARRRRRPGRRDARGPRPADGGRPARAGRGPHRPARPRGARADARRRPAGTRRSAPSSGVEAIRFVATSASRDAENRDEFVDGVRAALGVEPEVVDGQEEAALSFRGATGVLGARHPRPVPRGRPRRRLHGARAGHDDAGGGVLDGRRLRADDRAPPARRPADRRRGRGRAAPTSPPRWTRARAVVPLGRTATLVGLAGSVTTVTAHALRAARVRPDAHRRGGAAGRRRPRGVRRPAGRSREERAALRLHAPRPGRRHRRRRAGVGGRHHSGARRGRRRRRAR